MTPEYVLVPQEIMTNHLRSFVHENLPVSMGGNKSLKLMVFYEAFMLLKSRMEKLRVRKQVYNFTLLGSEVDLPIHLKILASNYCESGKLTFDLPVLVQPAPSIGSTRYMNILCQINEEYLSRLGEVPAHAEFLSFTNNTFKQGRFPRLVLNELLTEHSKYSGGYFGTRQKADDLIRKIVHSGLRPNLSVSKAKPDIHDKVRIKFVLDTTRFRPPQEGIRFGSGDVIRYTSVKNRTECTFQGLNGKWHHHVTVWDQSMPLFENRQTSKDDHEQTLNGLDTSLPVSLKVFSGIVCLVAYETHVLYPLCYDTFESNIPIYLITTPNAKPFWEVDLEQIPRQAVEQYLDEDLFTQEVVTLKEEDQVEIVECELMGDELLEGLEFLDDRYEGSEEDADFLSAVSHSSSSIASGLKKLMRHQCNLRKLTANEVKLQSRVIYGFDDEHKPTRKHDVWVIKIPKAPDRRTFQQTDEKSPVGQLLDAVMAEIKDEFEALSSTNSIFSSLSNFLTD